MTIPPAPPVPATRPAAPPRRDGAGPADPSTGEFTDLVREQLENERSRARTRGIEEAAASPEHGQGAGTAGAGTAVSAPPGAWAGLAGVQAVDQQGPGLAASPADGAARESELAGPAPGVMVPGAAALPGSQAVGAPSGAVAGDGSAAVGSPAAGPDAPTAGSVHAAGSVPVPAPSVAPGPASAAHLAAGPAPALDSASAAVQVSPAPLSAPVDGAAAPNDAAGTPVRLDATGAVSVMSAATPASSSTATSAGPIVDQALPVLNRLVSRGDGTHRMTLKLYPVELGEIQLTVTVRGDRVDVTFAAGARAREALRDGAGQLRGLLELAGRTTGHLLVRDLPGAAPSSPLAGVSSPSSAPAGAQFGDAGTGGGQWQEPGRDSTGPGGSRPDGHPGRTTRVAPVSAPATATTGSTGPATALDVRI